MKKSFILPAIFLIAGCNFQKPDYLTMLTPAELNKITQAQDVTLIDVHIPQQQHIKGTDAFIPYNEIEKHLDRLPQDKNTPIYLYCRSGRMADTAAETLHELGYKNLYNLEGGTEAWHKAGLAFQ